MVVICSNGFVVGGRWVPMELMGLICFGWGSGAHGFQRLV